LQKIAAKNEKIVAILRKKLRHNAVKLRENCAEYLRKLRVCCNNLQKKRI